MTPSTHTFLHTPQKGRSGGGVDIFVSNTYSYLKNIRSITVSSFEYMEMNFKCNNQWVSFVVVYRPPSSNVSVFLEEFGSLLDLIDMVSLQVFIVGDFNIWMDVLDNRDTIKFSELLDSYQLLNNVFNPEFNHRSYFGSSYRRCVSKFNN